MPENACLCEEYRQADPGEDHRQHVFQVHGADNEGSALFNRKLRRTDELRFFERLPKCLVGMEACGGAHYWAREIAQLSHDVRLIPPAYVKPFVKRGKTDAADAEAISEAVTPQDHGLRLHQDRRAASGCDGPEGPCSSGATENAIG
jgi:transposase